MITGNDVSEFQGDINWDTYKNNSKFVIIRSSYGTTAIDKKFARNQSEARRVNIPRGYYHYCYPQVNTPEAEAQHFINAIWPIQEGEVLVLDFEENYTGDPLLWCKKFLDYIAQHVDGIKALIYLNQSLIQRYNWAPISNAGYGLWVAAYTYDPNNNVFVKGSWPFAAMQQWTNKQQVPGIVGNVDGNAFFGDEKAFKAYGYKKPTPPPPPDPCANVKAELDSVKQTFAGVQGENLRLKAEKEDYAKSQVTAYKQKIIKLISDLAI